MGFPPWGCQTSRIKTEWVRCDFFRPAHCMTLQSFLSADCYQHGQYLPELLKENQLLESGSTSSEVANITVYKHSKSSVVRKNHLFESKLFSLAWWICSPQTAQNLFFLDNFWNVETSHEFPIQISNISSWNMVILIGWSSSSLFFLVSDFFESKASWISITFTF